MPEIKRMLLVTSVILIFLIALSYNFASFLVHVKYNDATMISDELLDIAEDTQDPMLKERIMQVHDEVVFITDFCVEDSR